MDMALEEIPVSGWTCFKTCKAGSQLVSYLPHRQANCSSCNTNRASTAYLVDVDLVALNSLLGTLLPATSGLLCDCLLGGLSRLLVSGLGCHLC